MPDFNLERAAGGRVAGIDEAGRGPLAGPVIAAAVILDAETLPDMLRDGIDDSKLLSQSRREELFAVLQSCAHIGIGGAGAAETERNMILPPPRPAPVAGS